MGIGAIGCFGPIQINKQSNLEGIMSKFKGTPGPWQPVFNPDSEYGDNATSIYSEDGIYVADVYRGYVGSEGLTEVEQKANAHLIAAAPEMLDVLMEIINGEGKFVMTADTHRKARAAIAKALGVRK